MAISRFSLEASGDQLSKATDALQEADDSLTERIPEEMRLLANRLAAVARSRVLEEPTFGVKQRGFRAELSAGVGVEDIPGGARITTSMPESNEKNLPQETDDPGHGWRHPVFGNRKVWVQENFTFSWFQDSVSSLEAWDDGMKSLQNVIDEAARQIASEVEA